MLLGGLGACDDARFGGTQYAKAVLKQLWGLPPALDMDYEKRVQAAVREIVDAGLAESAHDLSDGGLAVALAECVVRTGGRGRVASISIRDLRPELLLFHEGPSRVLVSTAMPGGSGGNCARSTVSKRCVSGVTMKEELRESRNGS